MEIIIVGGSCNRRRQILLRYKAKIKFYVGKLEVGRTSAYIQLNMLTSPLQHVGFGV